VPNERRSQADRRAATRGRLLAAARDRFASQGFEATSIEDVVRRAGVTRGALYHHFADKRDLFRAVHGELEAETDHLIRDAWRESAAAGRGPAAPFLDGLAAWLDLCLRPDVRRIMLIDAPAVLGWEEWHAIDARYALAEIEAGLATLIEQGVIDPQPVRPLAHLIHGAATEASWYIAAAAAPAAAHAEVGDSLQRLLRGLLRSHRPPAKSPDRT